MVPEEGSEQALELLRRSLEGGLELHTPRLLLLETASALRKYVLRGMLTGEQARRGLEIVSRTGLRLHETEPLEALRISLDHSVTVYDAAYLTVSKRLQSSLYTAYRRLIEARRGSGFQLVRLACRDTA